MNRSPSWFGVGPSELAKIGLILALAVSMAAIAQPMRNSRGEGLIIFNNDDSHLPVPESFVQACYSIIWRSSCDGDFCPLDTKREVLWRRFLL